MGYSFSANTKIWDSRRFLAEIRTVSLIFANSLLDDPAPNVPMNISV